MTYAHEDISDFLERETEYEREVDLEDQEIKEAAAREACDLRLDNTTWPRRDDQRHG